MKNFGNIFIAIGLLVGAASVLSKSLIGKTDMADIAFNVGLFVFSIGFVLHVLEKYKNKA